MKATKLFAAMLSLSLTGCLETKIRDTFVDRTAPDIAGSLAWLDPNSDALVSNAAYSQQSSMKASWVPSTSSDMTAQGVQLYIGAACNIASGSPVQYSSKTQSSHVFTGLPDGSYSFKVISYDRKNNTSYSDCSTGFTVDTSPPTVTVSAATSWINDTNKSSYAVSGTCVDAGAGISGNVRVRLELNGSNYLEQTTTCSSGLFSVNLNTTSPSAGGFTNGVSHLKLFAIVADQIGNNGESTQQAVSRDILAPTLASLNSAEWINNSTKSAYAVTGTCSDATSGLSGKSITVTMSSGAGVGAVTATGTASCSGGSFTASVNTSAFADTATANISITAAVEDVAGNSTTTAAITRKKDTVAPVLAITSPVTGGYVSATTSVPVTFTLVEQNAIDSQPVTFKQDGVEVSPALLVSNGVLNNNVSHQRVFTKNISTSGLSNNTLVGVSVDYADPSGNAATTASASYTVDTGVPTITSFTLNGGDSATMNNNVSVSLVASNVLSPVTHYCLKNKVASTATIPTAPTAQDACWTLISSASTSVAVTGFYQVGFLQDSYDVYAWVKNGAGLISQLSNGGNGNASVDRFTVNYNPGSPPVITAVQVTNLDPPSNPVTDAQLLFNSTSMPMYIKWSASDVDNNLGSNPIHIYYTTDNSTYIKLTDSPILNAANGSCDATGFTGCVLLNSPVSSGYFKIRVEAKDTNQTTVFYNSVPLNSTSFKVIAGNTETGFGGSAKTAIFNMLGSGSALTYVNSHRLAVSTDGKYFYIDPAYGLVWINPATGNLEKFIATDTTPTVDTADGSPVATAKLKAPLGIAIDYSDRLLIYDHDRIRRVDLSTMKIFTIIGGGSTDLSTQTTTVTDPRSVSLYSPPLWGFSLTMIPLPNGDLLFTSQNTGYSNNYDWKYKAGNNNTIEPIQYIDSNNAGMGNDPNAPWAYERNIGTSTDPILRYIRRIGFGIEFEPNAANVSANVFLKGFLFGAADDTYPRYARIDYNQGTVASGYQSTGENNIGHISYGTITTGLNGKIYTVNRNRAQINLYNSADNSITNQLGTGVTPNGPCVDNTAPTACAVDIDSFFVSRTGRIYFMDQGALRTINDNKVITLFGQFPSYNGANDLPVIAANARFGRITDLKVDRSSVGLNRMVVWDTFSKKFREVFKNGNVTNMFSTEFSMFGPFKFELDTSNGDVLFANNLTNAARIYRYNKTSDTSTPIVGGGSNNYASAASDELPGNQIQFSGYPRSLIGLISNQLYYSTSDWDHVNLQDVNCMVMQYDLAYNYKQSHFLGNSTCVNSWTAGADTNRNGTAINGAASRVESFGSTLLIGNGYSPHIYTKDAQSKLQIFAQLPLGIGTFTHSASNDPNEPNIYFCHGGNAIYQFNRTPGQITGVTTTHHLPQGVNCLIDSSIQYVENGGNKSIIFAFGQNGLYGVGEYILPP